MLGYYGSQAPKKIKSATNRIKTEYNDVRRDLR
jgi:hypothetical protein